LVSASELKGVAVDTNMLFAITDHGIRVFEELKMIIGGKEIVVPKQVLEELEKLAKEGKTFERKVEVLRKVLKENETKVIEVEAVGADNALEKLAKDYFIATNDKKLKKRIKIVNGKVIYLRKKKFLEID